MTVEPLLPTLPAEFITKLADISLKQFIRCSVYGELELLAIKGTVTKGQLDKAWMNLLSQYYHATGNKQMARYVKIKGKIQDLMVHIPRVAANVEALRMVRNPIARFPQHAADIIAELKTDGHKFAYTVESLEADLRRIDTIEKGKVMDLKKLQAEEERLQPKANDEKPTEDGFLNTLFDINKHEGTTYKAAELNVHEYCILVKRLERYIENLKQKTEHAAG